MHSYNLEITTMSLHVAEIKVFTLKKFGNYPGNSERKSYLSFCFGQTMHTQSPSPSITCYLIRASGYITVNPEKQFGINFCCGKIDFQKMILLNIETYSR